MRITNGNVFTKFFHYPERGVMGINPPENPIYWEWLGWSLDGVPVEEFYNACMKRRESPFDVLSKYCTEIENGRRYMWGYMVKNKVDYGSEGNRYYDVMARVPKAVESFERCRQIRIEYGLEQSG